MALTNSEVLDMLKLEYEKLTTEQRMYIAQYAPTLNIFGVTVLAGFATIAQLFSFFHLGRHATDIEIRKPSRT